jgi:cytochrome d ubiquinol oxidase subunit II
MAFLAVGVGLNVPLLLFYNWFAHHAFSGKLNSAPDRRDVPEA